MTLWKVKMGENIYKVTLGGFCWLRGTELDKQKKMETLLGPEHWNGTDEYYNAQETEDLLNGIDKYSKYKKGNFGVWVKNTEG